MTDQPNIPESLPEVPQSAAPQDTNGRNGGQVNETPEEMRARLERLGGEPAPDITPEEFARLQQSGQLHIDPRGRIRSRANEGEDSGLSLRKRRAWYRVESPAAYSALSKQLRFLSGL